MSNLTGEQAIKVNKLAELLKAKRAGTQPQPQTKETKETQATPLAEIASKPTESLGMRGELITYNARQQEFISLASKGESCILVGAAGTGKTTCMRGTINALVDSGIAGLLNAQGHAYLSSNTPGIVACAFTRRATANLKKAMPAGMEHNCITIHKLLEFAPDYFTVTDPVTGEEKNKMQFIPKRNKGNPLPSSIHTIIFEESSMISVELFKLVMDACPHNPQIIFLGDIQQLPPVMGSAILGYKMLELPVVELNEVYRQALESPIIRLAHNILKGELIQAKDLTSWNTPGQLTLHPWKKSLSADIACLTAAKFFTTAITTNLFNPEEDIVLVPFNKAFGSDELNKHIANHCAKLKNLPVYEVIAGFNTYYLHIGVKVLYDKEDMIVTGISRNPVYLGKTPQPESPYLDYWGFMGAAVEHKIDAQAELESAEALLELLGNTDGDDKSRAASHIITLKRPDSDEEIVLETAGELNSLLLGYAITVHKSQGSEWKTVFLVLHQSHNTMLQRELLYTGVTRAREQLYVICEPDSFVKGVISQRIKGNTLAQKAEYFKGKLENKTL